MQTEDPNLPRLTQLGSFKARIQSNKPCLQACILKCYTHPHGLLQWSKSKYGLLPSFLALFPPACPFKEELPFPPCWCGPALANEMLLEVTGAKTLNLLFWVWLASHSLVIYYGKSMIHVAAWISEGWASRPDLNLIQRLRQSCLRLTKEKTTLVVSHWAVGIVCYTALS